MSGGENQLVPLHSLSPDSLLIPNLMEEPLQPAHSNQLRSEGILPHTHYLSLTVLCCSSHCSSLFCWKSQSFTLSYHLFYFIQSRASFLSCALYTVYPPLSIFLFLLFTQLEKEISNWKYSLISRPTENSICACEWLKISLSHYKDKTN